MEIYYGLRGRLCKGVRLIPGGGACAIVRVACAIVRGGCAMLGFWVSARVRLEVKSGYGGETEVKSGVR
jgi:hypothetical protein